MTKRSVAVFIFIIVIFFTGPKISRAFEISDLLPILRIIKVIRDTASSYKTPSGPQVMLPFGGRIVESETACKLHYWVAHPVPPPVFYATYPGPPIPLFGTKIRVEKPGVPASNIFTFPGITKIYPNKHENKVGTMTLGIYIKRNFVKPVLDKVNSTVSSLPPISVGVVTFYNFSLKCPDTGQDGGIILKIGTN